MLRYNATDMFIKTFDSLSYINTYTYPYNYDLLFSSVRYNNETVFRHLLKHPRMRLTNERHGVASNICKYGNTDMLQLYLDATAYRSLPCDIINGIPFAIDTGNEQFVRLFLQHLTVDPKMAKEKARRVQLKRPGVSIGMLRLLHEEFNCLFNQHNDIWQVALTHSIKCNMMDSVQYIIDNIPELDITLTPECVVNELLLKCLCQCAIDGNIPMMVMLTKYPIFAEYMVMGSVDYMVQCAVDNGQQSFIKYMCQQHIGANTINTRAENMLINLRNDDGSIRITPVAAILSDDYASVESLIIDGLLELCQRTYKLMSKSMIDFIVSPRINVFTLPENALFEMVKCINKPGGHITDDHLCQLIVNCKFDTNPNYYHLLKLTAAFSPKVMATITSRSLVFVGLNFLFLLAKALKNGCRESLELLFKYQGDKLDNIQKEGKIYKRALKFVTKESLENITFMLDNIRVVERDPIIIEKAIKNIHPDVFDHVFNMFKSNPLLQDNIDRIMPLEQSTLEDLVIMAGRNAYHSLVYHFNSLTFTNKPFTHRLRTINSIMFTAYESGYARIIKLCADHITAITSNVSEQQEQVLVTKMQVEPCSRQLGIAVHTVFGNRKLGMIIMKQVGLVHKSLGVESKYMIKGAQLIDRHCLNDYIKYGATEWFLKAYTSSPLSNKVNNEANHTLLYTALTKCNTRVVDVLLANPYMTLESLDKKKLHYSIIDDMSATCTHPAWERMFDLYIAMLFGDAPFMKVQCQLSSVKHPIILRKLIQCHHVKLDTSIDNFDIDDFVQGCFNKPWALEMVQLLEQHSLLDPKLSYQICLKAIEHKITLVVQFYFEQSLDTWLVTDAEGRSKAYQLYNHCVKHGCVEFLDRIPMVDRGEPMALALARGNLDIANRILNMISTEPLEDEQEDDQIYAVDDVHHSILSVELLERLMSYPCIETRFRRVMGVAIKHGNKDVIEFIKQHNLKHHVNIDVQDALYQASAVFDLESIGWLLTCPASRWDLNKLARLEQNHVFNLLEHVDDKITQDQFKGLLSISLKIRTIHQLPPLLELAANKSLSVIQMVLKQFVPNDIDQLDDYGYKHFKVVLKRCDFDSLEYLLQRTKERPCDILNLELCNTTSLSYLFDYGHISIYDQTSDAVARLVDWACDNGALDIVRFVHERCTTPSQLRRHLPSFDSIDTASRHNDHRMLRYLFEGDEHTPIPPFKLSQVKLSARMLNSVRYLSSDDGNIKIIEMCDRLLGLSQAHPYPNTIVGHCGVKRTKPDELESVTQSLKSIKTDSAK
ncbi:hypothetical protein SAMD00019534_101150 [Acytostelium subglobosum LB1]|uniref:hypothetical protein n=1 Tax=Acytostelium subglobosum LB1 TaxID=1410327 RepID=UPI000644E411|nr:hypothetical protein SAMD00019534_101150 [Acytostelium subglobosum LB1]GAM26940.1 hypothetical protein SAMD00019534_101150 [Acytostelium subglobosum LB1]|eukprot:XP_012750208.1 hypothetical protein SAMD00019534_101150 [Acytostelium subglobosum LB1]